MRNLWIGALVALACCPAVSQATITFTPGHYYSAQYSSRDIIEYDSAGNIVGSITLPDTAGEEIRGLAFGPDGLLYATAVRGTSGFAVLALNSSGAIQQSYPMNVYAAGNISFGKLAVDAEHIYVGAQNQLTKFDVGNPASGTSLYTNNQIYDVEILPSRNLLVASAYEVNEITPAGAFVRSIAPPGGLYTDIRGIEYDPATNDLFVTHLGHTGFFFKLMRIDATTGTLEESADFTYADDLFLTDTGNLLVGSRTMTPRLYTQGLDQVGTLGGAPRIFVTQYVVPEPSTIFGGAAFMGVALLRRRRRRTTH
jgi:hypothetical protein